MNVAYRLTMKELDDFYQTLTPGEKDKFLSYLKSLLKQSKQIKDWGYENLTFMGP